MFDVLRAEALKMRSHRATWLMVWIIPILFALGLVFQVGRDLIYGAAVSVPVPAKAQAAAAAAWLAQNTMVWRLPLDGTGRFIIAGFTALVFAGEYGWNTWKLVVPVRARWQLIAAKWCVAAGSIFLALAAANAINVIAVVVEQIMGGAGAPASVTASAIVRAHATAALNALPSLLYTVAWAGFFAILTGSLLAAIGVSIVFIVFEQLLLPIGLILSGYAPGLTKLGFQVLPFYHSANVLAAAEGPALVLPLGSDQTLALAWQTSAVMLALWIAAIGAATLARFSRQDLN